MRRTLALFLYYFRWQRTMGWVTAIGIVLMLSGALLPPQAGFFPVALGSVFAIGFPVVFASIAFRLLISSRRLVMIPHVRTFAAIALLLVAVTASAVTLVFTNAISPDVQPVDPTTLVLLSFAAVSAYLLLTQWLVIYTFGLFAFVLVPFIPIRLGMTGSPILTAAFDRPWLMAALAVAGWIWLLIAMRAPTVPRPMAAPTWGGAASPQIEETGNYLWLPRFGPAASPDGTLMRGMPDGLVNRLVAVLSFVLSFPLGIWLFLFLIGAPFDDDQNSPFSATFFLLFSLIGIATHAEFAFSEWPARQRFLWLRFAGDRRQGWRRMERALLQDIVLIGGTAAALAVVVGLLASTEVRYLLLYVAGSVVWAALASYLSFWIRAGNQSRLVHILITLTMIFSCFASVLYLRDSETPNRIFWVLPMLIVLALLFRALGKRRMLTVDWCVVRPSRHRKQATPI